MLKIGITGSIGSGKSTVCKILETLGVPVYYADDRGKWLLQYDQHVQKQLIDAFGETVIGEDKIVNRAAIAEIVFKDPEKLKTLEGIVHPAVKKDFEEWFSTQNCRYIAKEAALLYEAGTYKDLDKMIAISAPLELRIQRVTDRDNLKREQILARMAQQWPDKKKLEMADYIVYNDEAQLLLPQVLKLHKMFSEA